MRIIERFDLYMEYKGLNDNKVTKQLELSNGTIGKSRKEGRDLSDRVIEKIENFYVDLNAEWLRTGAGEMILAHPAGNTQVIGSNHGTAINGGSLRERAQGEQSVAISSADVRELITQNGKLIDIIKELTQKK